MKRIRVMDTIVLTLPLDATDDADWLISIVTPCNGSLSDHLA